MKADLNILVLINLRSYGTGAVMQRSLYRDLFNQNGMDFVTEVSFCKIPVADIWKNVGFSNRRVESQVGKSFKVSLLYGYLRERARRTKSHDGIGYPSGQDGHPLGTTRCIQQAKFHQKPYNKSFIDQVCSVKMTGYAPHSFFASLWTSNSSRHAEKRTWPISSHLDRTNLANSPYILKLRRRMHSHNHWLLLAILVLIKDYKSAFDAV